MVHFPTYFEVFLCLPCLDDIQYFLCCVFLLLCCLDVLGDVFSQPKAPWYPENWWQHSSQETFCLACPVGKPFALPFN